jgi:hypothetical protein
MKGLLKKWGDFVEKSKQRALENETLETALEILQLRRGERSGKVEDSWSGTPDGMKVRVAEFLIGLQADRGFIRPETAHVLNNRLARIPPKDLQVKDFIPPTVSKIELEEVVSKIR